MGSIFASDVTQEYGIPNAPGAATITLRKLTGRELERAEAEHLKSTVAGESTRGWSLRLRKILNSGATNADAAEVLADPLTGFDRFVIIKAGAVKWSLERKLTTAALEDLDDETVDWMATEILRLTKPRLFYTEAELKAQQKNG